MKELPEKSKKERQVKFETQIGIKYYKEEAITPGMSVVLSQIFQNAISQNQLKLYYKAKVYELFSLYFNTSQQYDIEQCPFLADAKNVSKIKQAKTILLQDLTEPPTIEQLAQQVAISTHKLKEGFKEIYGDSVYSFLLTYKMDKAKEFLSSGRYNVNEVALKLGYSTASHFIAAFKRKFEITPKKYVMQLQA